MINTHCKPKIKNSKTKTIASQKTLSKNSMIRKTKIIKICKEKYKKLKRT